MRLMDGLLDRIEAAGNRLPDPATLFAMLILIVLGVSVLASAFGVMVTHPATDETIVARNLFSADLLQRLFTEMPATFAAFPPLGYVLLVMLGVGVAEKTGFLSVGLSALVAGVPRRLLTAAVVFAGIMSSLAVDAGYVVLIPLGAVVFQGAGRHPIAGLAAAFAGVAGGFSANLLLTPADPLLAGITQVAAQLIDPNYTVPVTANYYLMVMLAPVFVAVGTWVTDAIIEPRLGGGALPPVPADVRRPAHEAAGTDSEAAIAGEPPAGAVAIGATEKRGLAWAGAAIVLVLIAVAVMTVPATGALRGEGGSFDPFVQALVAIMFLVFLAAGLAYGVAVGTIRSDRDAVQMMSGAMADMGAYIVLAFFAAHFIALFGWSNLGIITAVSGARGLEAMGIGGAPLLVALIVLVAFLNILVGSASAKWAFLAPIFVPMLMLVGISPEATQAAYRVGDSITNQITPLLPYFPLILVFARRYDPRAGIGTLIATMLPYSLAFGIASTLVFVIWILAGLPLGPGSGPWI